MRNPDTYEKKRDFFKALALFLKGKGTWASLAETGTEKLIAERDMPLFVLLSLLLSLLLLLLFVVDVAVIVITIIVIVIIFQDRDELFLAQRKRK